MATLDLPEQYLRQLSALFDAHVPEAEVWAYGSRVSGRCHEASDLDLVLRSPTDLGKSLMWPLIGLREAIRESSLPILVDVLDWASIPQSFRDEIEQVHVVIHAPRQATTEIQHASAQSLARLGGGDPGLPDIPRRGEGEGT